MANYENAANNVEREETGGNGEGEQQQHASCFSSNPNNNSPPTKSTREVAIKEDAKTVGKRKEEEDGASQQQEEDQQGRAAANMLEKSNGQGPSKGRCREKRGPGPIPDRWIQYRIAIGNQMEGCRFLAFKTPLRPAFFELDEYEGGEEQRFEVETVIQHITSLNRTLGLVIDLTNTERYYDAKLWQSHKIQYRKIRCPGHEVNGDERFYAEFVQTIQQFFAHNPNNDELVGVHCTHGLNRTGYLICRFLIEQQNWSAQRAIDAFNVARGYPMERVAYIESLHEIEGKLATLSMEKEDGEEAKEEC